ncbi:MAG TPA: methyltransferase domain-containing protein [bacterium]|nr:methyltransferase domain-containing protein [bacterium]
MDDLNEAVNYNRWIYEKVAPHLGKRVLEVGCGTGNITGFLARGRQVLAVDIHQGYLDAAKKRWGRRPGLRFHRFDLERGLSAFKSFKPDTIISVNVLEHIDKDRAFLKACYGLLPPGGRVLIFVPAFQWLYGSMDLSYGHHRRYTRRSLNERLEEAGFRVSFCRYLNLLGVFGWFLNGRILRRKIIPKGQMLLYDRILKYVAPVEEYLPRPLGLSLLSVAVKPGPRG